MVRTCKTRIVLGAIVLGALAAGSLVACQNDLAKPAPRATDTPRLSDVPQRDVQTEKPINAPDIDLAMQRFDANIGDTATGVGGGGASE